MRMICFGGMVDQQKALNLIFNCDHCQRFSPLQIFDRLQVEFHTAQDLSLVFVESSHVPSQCQTPYNVFSWTGFTKLKVTKVVQLLRSTNSSLYSLYWGSEERNVNYPRSNQTMLKVRPLIRIQCQYH